jgi:hypothetical protein
MQVVVTYTNPEDQALGIKALECAQIPFEVRAAEDDGGVGISEVSVPDDQFDRACDIIEALEAIIVKERQAARKMLCSACGAELETCEDADVSGSITGITCVLKCRGCGRLIPR